MAADHVAPVAGHVVDPESPLEEQTRTARDLQKAVDECDAARAACEAKAAPSRILFMGTGWCIVLAMLLATSVLCVGLRTPDWRAKQPEPWRLLTPCWRPGRCRTLCISHHLPRHLGLLHIDHRHRPLAFGLFRHC